MKNNIFSRIVMFYVDGFRNLSSLGRQLWLIILLKLLLIFILLKLLFFPDFLKSEFDSDKERSEHVIEQLTR
jgi:hypothetical protein